MLNSKKFFRYINFVLMLVIAFGAGVPASLAATDGEIQISGWIPYWSIAPGAKVAENNIDTLNVIHPFGYSVKTDGTLSDLAKVSKSAKDATAKTAWQNLFKLARKNDVEVIPTVMWSSGADIHRILSDKSLRRKHVKAIASMVKKERFDGVNIDYEGKFADTKNDFSTFLKELKKELGKNKILSCAIEARTPPDSLYRVVPENIRHANDLKAIGKYCDEVEVMTYDQGRADLKLNGEKAGAPYIPVADTDWVRKVAEYMVKDIPKSKLVLGVATYGHEYIITVSPNWFKDYKKVQSVNHPYAMEVATTYGITPSRDRAGELSFSYLPTNDTAERKALVSMLPSLSVPAGTLPGEVVAQKALAYANMTGKTVTFNMVRWSDAEAIEEKVSLARELGLKGVALFKIDGEEDPALWSVLGKNN